MAGADPQFCHGLPVSQRHIDNHVGTVDEFTKCILIFLRQIFHHMFVDPSTHCRNQASRPNPVDLSLLLVGDDYAFGILRSIVVLDLNGGGIQAHTQATVGSIKLVEPILAIVNLCKRLTAGNHLR